MVYLEEIHDSKSFATPEALLFSLSRYAEENSNTTLANVVARIEIKVPNTVFYQNEKGEIL